MEPMWDENNSAQLDSFLKELNSEAFVKVNIFHKPRGGANQSKWIPIEENERVRVSSKSGRLIIVTVELSNVDASTSFQLNSQNCHISLLHREDGVWKPFAHPGAFETISCEESGIGIASFNVRISCRQPKVAIQVTVTPSFSDTPWTGQSVQFTPHNSGASKVRGNQEPSSPAENTARTESDSASSPTAQPIVDFGRNPDVVEGDLLVHGTLTAREFLQYSDIRLKTDISDISNALDAVQRLQGKTYRWKRGARAGAPCVDATDLPDASTQKTVGFIAQEVQRILPELVKTDQDGFLSVAYAEMLPVVVEAFKEHLRQYQQAKEEIQLLESQQLKKLTQISTTLQEIYERVKEKPREKGRLCGANTSKRPWMIIIFSAFAVVTAALVITIAVLLTNRAYPPGMLPPNFISWTSSQTLTNTSFEAPDPFDASKAAGWAGIYTRVPISSLPPTFQTSLFFQGDFVVLMNGSTPTPPAFSDCMQTINVSSFLGLQDQGLPADTRVWGSVTASVWSFILPLNQQNPTGELRLLLKLFKREDTTNPIAYVEALRLPVAAPGEWNLLNVTDLELPLPVSSLGIIQFALISTIPSQEALVAVDVAAMTFKFRSGDPPVSIALDRDITEPSPPISQPNITTESILSSMSISFFWNCSTCQLSFSNTPDVHTVISQTPSLELRATGSFFYHLSDEKEHKVSANFATNGSAVLAQYRILKVDEFWTSSISSTKNATIYMQSSNCSVPGTGAYFACEWTFRLDRVLVGSSLEISFSSQTAPYAVWMKDVFVRNREAPLPQPTLSPASVFARTPLQPLDQQIARSDCPHIQSGLEPWTISSSWVVSAQKTGGYGVISLPPGRKVILTSSSIPESSLVEEIIVPTGSELIFDDAPITLRVGTIRVFGRLLIGSPACRIFSKLRIVFDIEKAFGNQDDTKGIIVSNNAVLDIHGKQYTPTWTRLSQSAYPASDKIFLQQIVNWEVGQQVLIATSFSHDAKLDFHETMTVAAVQGNVVQFTRRLKYLHYANMSNYQTEVALLSRRVVLEGDTRSMDTRMSGYVIANGSNSQIRLSGVELFRMGQYNSFQRDSLVLHKVVSSVARPSFISDCAFNLAHYRCSLLLGSSGVLFTRNVCFRPKSHGFMLMYGIEENNTFSYNFVARPEFRGLSRDRLSVLISTNAVPWKESYDVLIDPSEPACSGFFISNPRNLFFANAVSGGWAGYLFAWYDQVLMENISSYIPNEQIFLGFEGNTAHSTASDPYVGGVHFGAAMTYSNGKLLFSPSRGLGFRFQAAQRCVLSNVKTWLTSYGLLIMTYGCSIKNSESWDNRAAFLSRGGSIESSIVSFAMAGRFSLPTVGPVESPDSYNGRYGIEVLSTKTADLFIRNTTFAALPIFQNDSHWSSGYYILNRGPQEKVNLAVRQLSFATVDTSFVYRTDSESTSIIDLDGSLTGLVSPSVMGGSSEFWSPFSDCNRTAATRAFACPLSPGRGVATARARFDLPIAQFNATLCNNASSLIPSLQHVNQGEFSAITGECVYLWTEESTYSNVTIEPRALPQSVPMFVAIGLPSNMQGFTVTKNDSSPLPELFLDDLTNTTNSDQPAFFRSPSHLFVRVADITGRYPVVLAEGSLSDSLPQLLPRQPIQISFNCSGSCIYTIEVPNSIAHLIGPR